MNDIFTQVVELARSLGLGKLGHVAIDSTRMAANASTRRTDNLERITREDVVPTRVSFGHPSFALLDGQVVY
jgi:hypothetical protein